MISLVLVPGAAGGVHIPFPVVEQEEQAVREVQGSVVAQDLPSFLFIRLMNAELSI
ncbi:MULTISPECIES: hypothetical protein [Streptomyces]|uniref:hypothetical protein n=1 Tax=Streptomyces TaxID=1883 RepID=UPI00131B5D91|nr:hypothetical protein [Streptomyces rubrolavendulae]